MRPAVSKFTRAVRRAAPRRPAVPSGDGAPYSAREGFR